MPMREQLELLVDEMVTKGIRYDEAQREFEKKFIMHVLRKADGNLGKAVCTAPVFKEFARAFRPDARYQTVGVDSHESQTATRPHHRSAHR